MAWRIGNGRRVNITVDRWIGVDDPSRPEQLLNEALQGGGVDKLIDDEERRWKHDLIHQIFTPEYANTDYFYSNQCFTDGGYKNLAFHKTWMFYG